MNYKQLIDHIRYISESHPLVSSFEEGDNVFEMNVTDNCYPVVYITPQPHSINNPMSTFNFVIYYVDRLLDSKINKIDIQSAGLKTLNDIVFDIDNLYNTESQKPFRTIVFTEKFSDECAGAFIELAIDSVNENTDCNSLSTLNVFIQTEEEELIISEENENLITE